MYRYHILTRFGRAIKLLPEKVTRTQQRAKLRLYEEAFNVAMIPMRRLKALKPSVYCKIPFLKKVMALRRLDRFAVINSIRSIVPGRGNGQIASYRTHYTNATIIRVPVISRKGLKMSLTGKRAMTCEPTECKAPLNQLERLEKTFWREF